jgi:hypothetical protein
MNVKFGIPQTRQQQRRRTTTTTTTNKNRHRKWTQFAYVVAAFLAFYLITLACISTRIVTLDANSSANSLFFHHDGESESEHKYKYKYKHKSSSAAADKVRNDATWILQHWNEHVRQLQEELIVLEQQQQQQQQQSSDTHASPPYYKKPITAYIESSRWYDSVTIPGTGSREGGEKGIPPKFSEPLPLRTQTPDDLQRVVYPKVQSCQDIPSKLPIDRGLQFNTTSTTSKTTTTATATGQDEIVWNIGDAPTPPDFIETETLHCPVDADPYLPWIHDVFLQNGKVQFIAQNKRRCKTGKGFGPDLERLEPQVALLQSVSVERLDEARANELAPELWSDHTGRNSTSTSTSTNNSSHSTAATNNATRHHRYRLVPYEQAADDGRYTRFICRFHTWTHDQSRVDLAETLSEYPFNYEYIAFRKFNNRDGLLSRRGKDNGKFWTATLLFSCPLPKELQTTVKDEETETSLVSIQNGNGRILPVLHVDIVPIRTPPRFPLGPDDDGYYFNTELVGKNLMGNFHPTQAWGTRHVLPRVEASGRWENLPVCPIPDASSSTRDVPVSTSHTTVHESASSSTLSLPLNSTGTNKKKEKTTEKTHLISACLWASATFRTRGKSKAAKTDTKARLMEWIEFHLLVGVDHIYVYDNSGAHTNETDLSDITDLYPNQVTRIDWPSTVCNNNNPANDNTGERSSQYAAENSCRTRFGPRTEWIATFDTDEYLVPMGQHTSLRTVVEQATTTNILSFRSSRGKLRYAATEPDEKQGRVKWSNSTYLQAYNCDGSEPPRPEWADRARKQLYRSDYVLYHFVHYAAVTQGYLSKFIPHEGRNTWGRYYTEPSPSERVTDELHEATMIHTKGLDIGQTWYLKNKCQIDSIRKWQGCFLGFPFPNNTKLEGAHDETDGWEYNCFVNDKVENYWIPRLEEALVKRDLLVTEKN